MSNKSILKKFILAVAVLSLSSQVSFAGKFHSKPTKPKWQVNRDLVAKNAKPRTYIWFFEGNRCELNLDNGHLAIIGNNTDVKFSSVLFNEYKVLRKFVKDVSFEGNFKGIKTLRTDLNEVSLDSVCPNLLCVEISGYVKIIELGAFYKSPNFMNIKISGNVKRIETGAFCSCPSLVKFTHSREINYVSPDAFIECNSLVGIRSRFL